MKKKTGRSTIFRRYTLFLVLLAVVPMAIVSAFNFFILYNSNEFSIYTMYGVCRYQGSLKEGNIQNIFRVAGNRYMVIMENGIQTIKLG